MSCWVRLVRYLACLYARTLIGRSGHGCRRGSSQAACLRVSWLTDWELGIRMSHPNSRCFDFFLGAWDATNSTWKSLLVISSYKFVIVKRRGNSKLLKNILTTLAFFVRLTPWFCEWSFHLKCHLTSTILNFLGLGLASCIHKLMGCCILLKIVMWKHAGTFVLKSNRDQGWWQGPRTAAANTCNSIKTGMWLNERK